MIDRFLTGGYAEMEDFGVCRFAFDRERGFRAENKWAGFINPSFILPHPRFPILYTVEETSPEGAVRAWRIEGDSLTPLGGFPSGGDSPCHLSLSAGERYLYAANYMNGTLAVFALDGQGNIEKRTDLWQLSGHGPNLDRQEGPHAHFSMERDGLLYVCDLGADRIAVFENQNGKLKEKTGIALPPGCGPRHLAFSPVHPHLFYCVTELENSVYVISREGGTYTVLQCLSTLPEAFQGESFAAAIHFSPDGRALMASNRGHDSIAVFALRADGTLDCPAISPCAAFPRDFAIFDQTVIVGSQRDGLIRAYTLDKDAFTLTETPFSMETKCPVCFAKL
ncbi:MAG: lactonase family protein [Clostridia bacterium]|nr:lactonase family protein [Clostridia bacterium]